MKRVREIMSVVTGMLFSRPNEHAIVSELESLQVLNSTCEAQAPSAPDVLNLLEVHGEDFESRLTLRLSKKWLEGGEIGLVREQEPENNVDL